MRTYMTRGKKRRPRWAIVTAMYPSGRTYMSCMSNALSERNWLVKTLATYKAGGAFTNVAEVNTATMRRLMALQERVEAR